MLVKVQFWNSKKFIKLQDGFTYVDFINKGTALRIYDDTDTEIEEDILHELLKAKPDMMLTVRDNNTELEMLPPGSSSCTDTLSISSRSSSDLDQTPERPAKRSKKLEDPATAAKEVVLAALNHKAGGDAVLADYRSKNTLTSETRRVLVNILVGHMVEMHGRIPTRNQREQYALGIVILFPALRDPYSKKGYEHFNDVDSGTGYLAWRLKTVQRNTSHRAAKGDAASSDLGGPCLKRSINPEEHLDEDAVREAIALLCHTSEEGQIFFKMKETFHHRHGLVHDPDKTMDILKIFPRFLDTKGLVNQDFRLLFNPETANKLLEKWDTVFKPGIIEEAMGLTLTPAVRSLISSAGKQTIGEDHCKWDSNLATLLLLVHLLPPQPGGKRAAKISAADAADRLVVYHKFCNSIDEHVQQREGRQPYLLAVGRSQDQIDNFYVVLDKNLIPCQVVGSLSAFDELFNLTYDNALLNFYTFIQTTIYKIDVGKTRESPRVKELRAKLLND
ncbi:uncharacterized protein [Paramormyrops kingsleyae]|uniref:uncharacterized protein isoform X3 n=2 Tax=Paramormyrops kingsleyae TaxID=1676925 RepID=UPI003B9713E0